MCFSSVTLSIGTINAATILHHHLLQTIIRLPMMFFDVTPIGRILSRFSTDVNTLDLVMPGIIQMFLPGFFRVLKEVYLSNNLYGLLFFCNCVVLYFHLCCNTAFWSEEALKQIVFFWCWYLFGVVAFLHHTSAPVPFYQTGLNLPSRF